MGYIGYTSRGTPYAAMDLADARRRWPLPPLEEYDVYKSLVNRYEELHWHPWWSRYEVEHREDWRDLMVRAEWERDCFANGYPENEYKFLMDRENANRAEAADVRAGCPYIVNGRCTAHGERCGWLPDYVSSSSSEEEGEAVPTRCLVL